MTTDLATSPPPPPPSEQIKAEDAARMLGVSRATYSGLLDKRLIASWVVGEKKRVTTEAHIRAYQAGKFFPAVGSDHAA